eukprot:1280977-Alexandrium_andersonii.AAC.1
MPMAVPKSAFPRSSSSASSPLRGCPEKPGASAISSGPISTSLQSLEMNLEWRERAKTPSCIC